MAKAKPKSTPQAEPEPMPIAPIAEFPASFLHAVSASGEMQNWVHVYSASNEVRAEATDSRVAVRISRPSPMYDKPFSCLIPIDAATSIIALDASRGGGVMVSLESGDSLNVTVKLWSQGKIIAAMQFTACGGVPANLDPLLSAKHGDVSVSRVNLEYITKIGTIIKRVLSKDAPVSIQVGKRGAPLAISASQDGIHVQAVVAQITEQA